MDQDQVRGVEVREDEDPETSETLINQSLIKLSLRCEFCYLFDGITEQQPSVRLVPCKIGEKPNQKKSALVLCDIHYQIWGDYQKFNQISEIKVEIFPPDIKRAKVIQVQKNDNVNPQFLMEEKSYCCRKLIASYLATLKTLYKVEGCDAEKSVDKIIETRKQELIMLQKKFKYYIDNKDKMSFKQKFLMTQQIKKLSETGDIKDIQVGLQYSAIGDSRISALQQSGIDQIFASM